MSDTEKMTYGGIALILLGLGLILFGGNRTVRENGFEIFGFNFGHRQSEPMSRAECLFWGIPMIVGGCILVKHGW